MRRQFGGWSFWDFSVAYSGKPWTQEEQAVLQLLYLGVNYHLLLIEPFWAKNDTSRIFKEKPVKPTLSPKDHEFPAWWEPTGRVGSGPKIKVNR